jgi:hypothetical protein
VKVTTISALEVCLSTLVRNHPDFKAFLPSANTVRILNREGRKVRKNTPLANWNPMGCKIEIEIGCTTQEGMEADDSVSHDSPVLEQGGLAGDPLTDLLQSLDKAEREPDRNFVALHSRAGQRANDLARERTAG